MVMPLDEHPAVLVGCYLGQVSKLKPAAVGHQLSSAWCQGLIGQSTKGNQGNLNLSPQSPGL